MGKEDMVELVVLLGRTTEGSYVVQIEETEVQDFHKPVVKCWKVWVAFLKPKDMKGNSKRPKWVVIADLVSVRLGENLVVYSHQGNCTYYTHSLYFFLEMQ